MDKPKKALTYALSLLEQVRCEAFINRSQEIDIQTNHWEDFEDAPTTQLTSWDVERKTLKPTVQKQNNFNRVASFFNLLPDINENYEATAYFKNQASIDQTKEVTKGLTFPNLYVLTDVENQTKEYLKFTSGFREDIIVNVTWKFLLFDLGDWLSLVTDIGGTRFDGVPIRIRDLAFNSKGMKLSLRCWSFQMMPFGSMSSLPGVVAGQNATITT